MLRVALVITELDVGGAERQLLQLATGLDRRFFKPRIYALGSPPPAGGDELLCMAKAAEIPVEFLGARRWWQLGPTVDRLAGMLREFQPQVMQSFLFHANVAGSMAARQAGVPFTSLGLRVNDPSWWRARIERRVAQRADRVVSVSKSVAAAAAARLRLRPEQSVVIRNGVDVTRFESQTPADLTKFGIPRGVKPVVYVGRLDRQKGADRLLLIAEQLATIDAHLLVVGQGKLAAALRAQATKHSPTRVHFAGWQADVASILAASALLVLPSRYEGMPNAVLEAMASALPVLATPVEGVREVLGDDRQQVLDFDPVTWSDTLGRWMSSAELRNEAGVRNQELVRQRFSTSAMVELYERLFSGLAGTTRPN